MAQKFIKPYVGTDTSKQYTPDSTYSGFYVANLGTASLSFNTTELGTLPLLPGQSFLGYLPKGVGVVTITNASACQFLVSSITE
jgi:hypothetical protein